jgi:myo-inositol 2-dehydrogenase / D-chiro-inositol 1-dehydrogenase
MSKTIRIGIIGCGAIGVEHGNALAQIEGAKVVAACDVIASRADDYCSTFGAEYATTDPARVIRDPTVDAVYVLTQHDSHADLCVRAAEAGKHVLVEKPLALTVENCLRVGHAVQHNGITLMTGFKMRYYDLVQRAKGILSHPLILTMQMMDNRWPDDFWANDPIKGGGNVLSQGCHSCDLLRFMAGSDPIEVYAAGSNYYQPSGVIDNVCATFKFANGTVASWVQGDCRVPTTVSKFYLQGFDKDLSVTLSDRLTRMVVNTPAGVTETRSTETGFVEENRAFIHALHNGLPAPIDHRDGLYATLMALQAFASLRSGKPEPIAALMAGLAS